jgi:hypothetical protein
MRSCTNDANALRSASLRAKDDNNKKRRLRSIRDTELIPQASHIETQLDDHAVENARRGPTSTKHANTSVAAAAVAVVNSVNLADKNELDPYYLNL